MMDIAILPPDINEGESGFSVSGDGIRYGLSAIKSVGRPVVDAILEERKKNGIFSSMEDFINRMTNKEVNRRTIENFIKSGAMDSLPGTRRQKVAVAPILLDNKARERKNAWEGQMSLFDLVSEEEKKEYQVSFPDVTPKRVILMIALSLYSGFTAQNIDNAAHVGGLVTGFLAGLLFCPLRKHRRQKQTKEVWT